MALLRSADDLLSAPRGVCRDYAVLYTALARAEGAPTRLCAGIVAVNGMFYYHAWAETYVGRQYGWIAVDPTMKQHRVDATHVAFVRGDAASMADIAYQIGSVNVRILDARYQ